MSNTMYRHSVHNLTLDLATYIYRGSLELKKCNPEIREGMLSISRHQPTWSNSNPNVRYIFLTGNLSEIRMASCRLILIDDGFYSAWFKMVNPRRRRPIEFFSHFFGFMTDADFFQLAQILKNIKIDFQILPIPFSWLSSPAIQRELGYLSPKVLQTSPKLWFQPNSAGHPYFIPITWPEFIHSQRISS